MITDARLYMLAIVVAASVDDIPGAWGLETRIQNIVYNNNGFGGYSYEFKTPDGTYRREDGGMVASATGDSMVVRGEYGFIDPAGQHHAVRYVADANGYQLLNEDDTRFNDRRIV